MTVEAVSAQAWRGASRTHLCACAQSLVHKHGMPALLNPRLLFLVYEQKGHRMEGGRFDRHGTPFLICSYLVSRIHPSLHAGQCESVGQITRFSVQVCSFCLLLRLEFNSLTALICSEHFHTLHWTRQCPAFRLIPLTHILILLCIRSPTVVMQGCLIVKIPPDHSNEFFF